LLEAGVIDDITPISYAPEYRRRIYGKHFAGPMRQTHSNGGYPILGSIAALEESRADFLVHFDSDMLLYQDTGTAGCGNRRRRARRTSRTRAASIASRRSPAGCSS
jgi:hypothetical protein